MGHLYHGYVSHSQRVSMYNVAIYFEQLGSALSYTVLLLCHLLAQKPGFQYVSN